MKKLFLSLILLFILFASYACPICGCGVGGFYIGLLPANQSSFIGLRYQYSKYSTHLFNVPDQFSEDHYYVAELWGGFTLGEKWQLLSFVPYHFNKQNTDDGLKTKNGLGDITVLANYKLWQSKKLTQHNKSLTQEFWFGAGVKLPTGTYNVDLTDPETELGDVNSQMGTGSVDFIVNAMYNIHLNKTGINTTINYKINTANNSNFKYGDRFSANSFAYYQAKITNAVYAAPNIGVLYEHASANYLSNNKVNETGGYVTIASAGVEVNYRKITVGANVQLPFAQEYAHGQTVAKTRGLVHVTYAF